MDPSGSATIICKSEFFSLKNSANPVTVPPEPTPATNASNFPSICSQISGAVEVL